ncbi:MAG: ABC-F family ATP-binding cassette domain-containing protein [Thermogutta sp.]
MQVLHVTGLKKFYGPEPVLDGVTFDVFVGDHIGLVGPNGAGKTTLLKIIAGRETSDGGEYLITGGVKLGYLEQHADFPEGRTVWEEARTAVQHLVDLQQEAERTASQLAQVQDPLERRRLSARFDHLQQELHRLNAYHLDHKIEQVLEGLGLGAAYYDRPAQQLSGGERNRLLLAKVLLGEPDIMLLDEPSNHLDIEATQWLEEFLANHRGAMMIVSHDRYFLDKVTNRTFELFRGTVEAYPGNFSAYLRQKQERLLVAQRTYEKQREEIAKAEEFIRRHHYGQKAAQAQDRRKKLERIELVEPPRQIEPPPIRFPPAERSSDVVLRVENLGKAFDRPLFSNLTFDIARGEVWGILGPNGCGKTTLLRCLLGQIPADVGRVIRGYNVVVGYFDQHLACLPEDLPAMDAVLPTETVSDDLIEQKRRDLLAKFGLTGDRALTPVKNLSGGERCRVALARLTATRANFLVLDEPTNHLDLWACSALEHALKQFDGTVLFVSHDRYFIDQIADHLIVFEPERVRIVHGNYSAYLSLRGTQDEVKSSPVTLSKVARDNGSQNQTKSSRPDQPNQSVKKKRRFPYRKQEDIEADILQHESRRDDILTELSLPETHRNGSRAKELKAELDQIEERLQQLYAHWEEVMELNS